MKEEMKHPLSLKHIMAAIFMLFFSAETILAGLPAKPNIIFIMADDLGYAEVGCYGQTKIKTPYIDALARQGMKFTQHYSGNPVCAPSRCVLMTGKHSGQAQIRGNKQIGGKEGWKLGSTTGGQWPLKADTVTIGKILQKAGYVTGAFGKWGLGTVGSTGDPQQQGFDHFYGYICQRQAHTFYPNHLWRDGKVDPIPENEDGQEKRYSHDLIANEALKFIKTYKDQPFFCYVPFTIPHVSLQVPEDSRKPYLGQWEETPFKGSSLYTSQSRPRATYAAMVSRMDRSVGQIMALLKALELEDNTIVIFTSDNGPTFNGGSDSSFFESAKPFRGLKGSMYEGGIRIPYIIRWPGHVRSGSLSDHISSFQDFLPTCTELLKLETPGGIDGVSMLPTWLGKSRQQKQHDYLYWELSSKQGIRKGDWKAIRRRMGPVELYNLGQDIGEQKDVSDQYPEITAEMTRLFTTARTESEVFPLVKKKK